MLIGGDLLWILALHLLLTALPGAAAALGLARRGVRSVAILLVAGMAATGVVAMLAFWLYFAAPEIGKTFSYLVLFGSVLAVGWLLWERQIDGALLRRLAVPTGLWALGTYFLVFLGFAHGGEVNPLGTAATRFWVGLPSDNAIPIFFAEWFYAHGHQTPVAVFGGEWLSSDRPPLQVGYTLWQLPFFGHSRDLHYQALGVGLQQLWIIAAWALLDAARASRVTRGLVMITVLVSDVAIVNGFFVWPKMLPAAMLLGVAALVLTPLWNDVRRSYWGAALIAALVGLAMMGHGGSVFGFIPLVIVGAWRGLPNWRWLGVAVLVGLLFMAPWSAYQKWVDPPGNRLLKYMLAGEPEINETGTLESIENAYSRAGIGGALHYKAENYITMFGGGPMVEALHRAVDDVGEANWSGFVDELRIVLFFELFPSLGLLLIVPIVMALARSRGRLRKAEWDLSLLLWAALAIGAFFWGLIMFGDPAGLTVMHAGSFALPLFGFIAAVVGLRAVYPRFAIWYSGIAAALMLALYVPDNRPLEGGETVWSVLAIVTAALALALFLFVAFRNWGAADGELEAGGAEAGRTSPGQPVPRSAPSPRTGVARSESPPG
jgi:hypothetical protein